LIGQRIKKGDKMTVRSRRIFNLHVQAVRCPMVKEGVLDDLMVRLKTCRSCKYHCGEHGGEYIECNFDHATLRIIEDKEKKGG